ncbi:peptidoglycan-binding domain-containing protein [Streptomyces sp. NPDC047197]|uniref:peptidoglycan-binding domain-containing protein n=1 Tax=Streptomyces sp. NPDC047197 TaxID=3155477 RepID=UPI003404762D
MTCAARRLMPYLGFDSVYDESNAVCLWQKVLWAEGTDETNGTNLDPADIDGIFGPSTRGATEEIQDRWGLVSDGVPTSTTLSRAQDRLKVTGGSEARGKQLNSTYNGDVGSFSVIRNSEGKYAFRDGDNEWRNAGYRYRTCR